MDLKKKKNNPGIHPYNRILLSHKKRTTTDECNEIMR
jgi:hypothetical protein